MRLVLITCYRDYPSLRTGTPKTGGLNLHSLRTSSGITTQAFSKRRTIKKPMLLKAGRRIPMDPIITCGLKYPSTIGCKERSLPGSLSLEVTASLSHQPLDTLARTNKYLRSFPPNSQNYWSKKSKENPNAT